MKTIVNVPLELKDVVVGDEEELIGRTEDLYRVPRNGRRKLMPIERVWDRRDS